MLIKARGILFMTCLAIYSICQTSSHPAGPQEYFSNQANKLPTIEDVEDVLKITDKAEKTEKIQEIGVGIVKRLFAFATKSIQNVDKLVKQSEESILELKKEAGSLNLEEFEVTKNFFTNYNSAKLELLGARRKLVELASRTVLICDKIDNIFTNWEDKHAKYLIKRQYNQIEKLVDYSNTTLTEAKEKYVKLIEIWTNIDVNIAEFKDKLNKAVDVNTVEYEKWESKIRAEEYGVVTSVTVGMIIADIFGCLGLCSGIGIGIANGVAEAKIEKQIAKFKGELRALEAQTANAIEHLHDLDNVAENAADAMKVELNLVIKWKAANENMEDTLNDLTVDDIEKIKSNRFEFVTSVKALKVAAQDYYDFATGDNPWSQGNFPNTK